MTFYNIKKRTMFGKQTMKFYYLWISWLRLLFNYCHNHIKIIQATPDQYHWL